MRRSLRLPSVAILFLFFVQGCDRAPPTAASLAAGKQEEEQGIRILQVDPLFFWGGSEGLLFRPLSPESSVLLLFRPDLSLVYRIDVSTQALDQTTVEDWWNATGDVNDHIQIGEHASMAPIIQGNLNFLKLTLPPSTAGRHVMQTTRSPRHDKHALISADGNFEPQRTGIMFGGRGSLATGKHFIEIIETQSGNGLMKPILLPFKTPNLQVHWTMDERFLIVTKEHDQFCVIRTGLQASSVLQSKEYATNAKFRVFHQQKWWLRSAFDLANWRYRENSENALLLKERFSDDIYVYDPFKRQFSTATMADWNSANGKVWNKDELRAEKEKDQTSDPAGIRFYRNWGKAVVLATGEELPIRSGKPLKMTVSPDRSRVAFISTQPDYPDDFFHEVFDTKLMKSIGEPIMVPRTAACWFPDEINTSTESWGWDPKGQFYVYSCREHRTLCFVHHDLE